MLLGNCLYQTKLSISINMRKQHPKKIQPEQDKASVGNIGGQRWYLRALDFLSKEEYYWIRVSWRHMGNQKNVDTHQCKRSCIWGFIPVNDERAVSIPLLKIIIIILRTMMIMWQWLWGAIIGIEKWGTNIEPILVPLLVHVVSNIGPYIYWSRYWS